MKLLKKEKNIDFRWIAELNDYHKLNATQLDIAIHGVPYEGKRYPLCYVFWGKSKHHRVIVTLTGEVGTLIGESIIELSRGNIHRGVVKLDDGRITDLSYSVIHFM